MSKVILHRYAAKYLRRLPNDLKERINNILIQLGQNPSEFLDFKHIVDEWTGYRRICSGKFRLIFFFDEKEDIDHIGSRGDVYK